MTSSSAFRKCGAPVAASVSRLALSVAVFGLVALLAGGCESVGNVEEGVRSGDVMTYEGTVSGADTGTIVVTIDLSITVGDVQGIAGNAEAHLVVAEGDPMILQGHFDPDIKQVEVFGEGYRVFGTVEGDRMRGSYEGPNGDGTFTATRT